MKPPRRPVIRYYGGKWKLAEWIISHFPPHRCYVEPYGGAGSVLMHKKPSKVEVYNDLSDEIVNLFRVLRSQSKSKKLMQLLDLTPWSRTEWLSCYKKVKDPVEQARRTVVLAYQGHNPSKALNRVSNVWRSSSGGHHKMPQDFMNYTNALTDITIRLKQVMIENRPAEKVCLQHDSEETLHYLDPPYVMKERSTKGNFYQHELKSIDDHMEALRWANELEGFVMVSGYKNPEYLDFCRQNNWCIKTTTAVTGAAKKGNSKRTEYLYMNNKMKLYLDQYSLFKNIISDNS